MDKNQTTELTQELSSNFINYAAAVNTDRSIPDARSGLKPVAKRILFGAWVKGHSSNKPYVKCASIVGDVMGDYHPHGDKAIYDAMVRLSQDWVMRYPLLDFHGNQGNIAGDPVAHYRYTEARLSKLSEDGLLCGLKKKNVPFVSNYDERLEEPETLPAIFPNLLCNPNTGIGVSLACNWLPHNLKEVANAIYEYIDGKELTPFAPDFPTGGVIINADEAKEFCKKGKGSVKLRAKYKIEKKSIVFYEIPYGNNSEDLIKELGDACDKKLIEGVENIRDESNKKGLRIVVECEKESLIGTVVQQIFTHTNMQTSISYNQVGLVDKAPIEMTLKDCLKIYVEHNIECINKEVKFDLTKAKARLEIVQGLIKALENIDNVIEIIRNSSTEAIAKVELVKAYGFSEPQVNAIVDMRLGKLAGLEKIELEKEAQELNDLIEKALSFLNDIEQQKSELKNRLSAFVNKYGDDRRTELVNLELPKKGKIEITPEDVVVTLTKDNKICRMPVASYDVSKKGKKGTKTKAEIATAIKASTTDTLMMFTSSGKMYKMLVNNIPTDITYLTNVITLDNNEKILNAAVMPNEKYMAFVTKNGLIKKTDMKEYLDMSNRKTGVAAIKLKENDSIISVFGIDLQDVIVITKNGMAIRFNAKDISTSGRNTMGQKAISLNDGDEVIAAEAVNKDDSRYLITVSADGMGRKNLLTDYTTQFKGGKGVSILKEHLPLIGAVVGDDDLLLVSNATRSLCIKATDISKVARGGKGSIVIPNKAESLSKI